MWHRIKMQLIIFFRLKCSLGSNNGDVKGSERKAIEKEIRGCRSVFNILMTFCAIRYFSLLVAAVSGLWGILNMKNNNNSPRSHFKKASPLSCCCALCDSTVNCFLNRPLTRDANLDLLFLLLSLTLITI